MQWRRVTERQDFPCLAHCHYPPSPLLLLLLLHLKSRARAWKRVTPLQAWA